MQLMALKWHLGGRNMHADSMNFNVTPTISVIQMEILLTKIRSAG
jgi:hypothetical protein